MQLTGGDPWWATLPKALWPQGLQAEFAASSLWSDKYGDRQQVSGACTSRSHPSFGRMRLGGLPLAGLQAGESARNPSAVPHGCPPWIRPDDAMTPRDFSSLDASSLERRSHTGLWPASSW